MNYEDQLNMAVAIQTRLAPIVKKMLTPALNALSLDYFWFVRLLPGRFHISIGVQPPLVELYRKRKTEELYYKNPTILSQKQTTVFWDLHEEAVLTDDMLNRVGLKQGICVFRRKDDFVDVFYIAATQKDAPNIYDIYLNNSTAIFRLIGFFQEKVLPILPMDDKDFLLPYMDGCVLKLPPVPSTDQAREMSDFFDATQLKKFTLHKGNQEFSLSLRELQCLHHLSKGDSSKDIALALGLSFRTVEHYLLNIRNKTNCRDKAELIALYRKNDVAKWFDE